MLVRLYSVHHGQRPERYSREALVEVGARRGVPTSRLASSEGAESVRVKERLGVKREVL